MNDNEQKTKTVEYPRLLGSEMVGLITSLGIIRRLVASGSGQLGETTLCQQVADSLLNLPVVGSSCVYLATDEGYRCVASAGRRAKEDRGPCCPPDAPGILAPEPGDPGVRDSMQIDQHAEDGHCMLEVALEYGGERLGGIALTYPDAEDFQPWHEQLFRLCADIVSQSLVSLRLLRRLRRNLDEQDHKLHQIDATLQSETLRRESAESALLRNLSRCSSNDHLDQETGLLNRSAFTRILQTAADKAHNLNQQSFLLLLDIDHFQAINEVGGHEAGDKVLRMIAHLLGRELPPDSDCARLGTDEFGVLLQGIDTSDALDRASQLQQRVKTLILETNDEQFTVSVSIGMAQIHAQECPDVVELIRRAYSACRYAQEQSCSLRLFNDNDTSLRKHHHRSRKLGQVIRAIEEDTLELYCQPIAATARGSGEQQRFRSGEILVRMHDEQGELLSAGEIVTQAERFGLATRLDQRVVMQTLRQLERRGNRLGTLSHMAVNLSAQSIVSDEFLDFLVDTIGGSDIARGRLCFEITETAAILNIETASRLITTLKELGCTFALDDFGSGHASYLYLRDLDVDYLKIDGEFIRNMIVDPVNQTLVKTMVDMGKILGKQVIAEFVENEAIMRLVEDMEVDFVQGYFIGRPAPLQACLDSLIAGADD